MYRHIRIYMHIYITRSTCYAWPRRARRRLTLQDAMYEFIVIYIYIHVDLPISFYLYTCLPVYLSIYPSRSRSRYTLLSILISRTISKSESISISISISILIPISMAKSSLSVGTVVKNEEYMLRVTKTGATLLDPTGRDVRVY